MPIDGSITRRLLLNGSADPDAAARLLPDGIEPAVVAGRALVGVCVIELADVRPRGLPSWIGTSSRNVAHRIAVQPIDGRRAGHDVWVLRRDSAQVLPRLVGGRAFPGVHGRAGVRIDGLPGAPQRVHMTADDGAMVAACVRPAEVWQSQLFDDLDSAVAFLSAGTVGWSPGRAGRIDGVELEVDRWDVTPLTLDIESSVFGDSLVPDHGLEMIDVRSTWRRAHPRRLIPK